MLHEIRMPKRERRCLSQSERDLLLQIAQTVCPAGDVFPVADNRTVDAVDNFVAGMPRPVQAAYRTLLRTIDTSTLLRHGRRFRSLSADKQLRTLESWRTGGVARRLALRSVVSPIKVSHFAHPDFYRHIGCVYEYDNKAETEPRHMRERVHNTAAMDEPLELECDVVVVGTGAGGAVAAKELAERGHAVVMIEEGSFFKRHQFNGRSLEMQQKMYHQLGLTGSVGNVPILIPIGRTVGGTTTVNSGTCYRIPDRVLRKWRDEFGLADFTPDNLNPYYERVEDALGVEAGRAEYLGGVARVIARGCDALGYDHNPLRRNAPDCDGQGVCCFGCPTDAKRSTNVSYVPMAVKAGAELFHNARVHKILTEGGRAVGVVAHSVSPGVSGHVPQTLTIRAQAVVIACGTLSTPLLLGQNGLGNSSGTLGTNLSIHPACAALALFDEDISAYNAIPQGYAIEEFHEEGLLYEGATTPIEMGMAAVNKLGPDLTSMAEDYKHIATFGFMVEDSSRGRVRMVRGQRVITYNVNKRDVARLKRGMEILTRVFLAAGAKEVYPMVHGFDRIRNEAELNRFRRTKIRASDFELSAYHPLGTARMGMDPTSAVVGPNHECFDVPGLYITDGSSVPSSVAVNPQVTIMAMATRAAELIDRALN